MDTKSLENLLAPVAFLWKYKVFTVADVKLSLGNVLMALILLLLSPRISKMISKQISKRLISRFVHDPSSQNTYQTFAFYGSLAAVVAMSLTFAGIPLTIFTVVGGALAIGIGFGSQNIVNNFISGIIMLVEQPIKVGDMVDVDGMNGRVLSIGTRSTKIKNLENKVFIVPNSFFLEKSVLNWSFENPIVRTSVAFGVAYGSDVRKVENICMDILLNDPQILQNPLPQVFFDDFSDSTLTFQMMFHCDLNSVASLAKVRSDVRFKVDEKFRALGVEMAFPQRDLHFKPGKVPLEIKVLS